MYRACWRKGLKTTYYLRTLGASNIEKATVSIKKQVRGLVAQETTGNAIENTSVSTEVVDLKNRESEPVTACSLYPHGSDNYCEACQ